MSALFVFNMWQAGTFQRCYYKLVFMALFWVVLNTSRGITQSERLGGIDIGSFFFKKIYYVFI